jgi:hypothetical protein
MSWIWKVIVSRFSKMNVSRSPSERRRGRFSSMVFARNASRIRS